MNYDINQRIKSEIEEADFVLVGLGNEFDLKSQLKNNTQYQEIVRRLKEEKKDWLIPIITENYRKLTGLSIDKQLNQLTNLLKDKNYYIISTSLSEEIREHKWLRNHLVMPLGSTARLQCCEECDSMPYAVKEADLEILKHYLENLPQSVAQELAPDFGICPKCQKKRIFNTAYSFDAYDERGYLEDWKRYTTWLQLTLNKKLVLLELGEGLLYPEVIRLPFERVARINQKSILCRINSDICQLPEGLAREGISLHENAIDWLESL